MKPSKKRKIVGFTLLSLFLIVAAAPAYFISYFILVPALSSDCALEDFIEDGVAVVSNYDGRRSLRERYAEPKVYSLGENRPSMFVKLNNFDFRADQDYALEKDAGRIRIAVLGDSFTFGEGVEIEQTYPMVLERKLNGEGKERYEVLNFGVPAMTNRASMERLRKTVLPFSPDLVVFQTVGRLVFTNQSRLHALNDWVIRKAIEVYDDPGIEAFVSAHVSPVFEWMNMFIESTLWKQYWSETCTTFIEREVGGALRQFRALAEEGDFKPFYFPISTPQILRQVEEEVCAELGITYVPLKEPDRGDLLNDLSMDYSLKKYGYDDNHPSPEGHVVLAESIYQALLETAPGPPGSP